MRWDWAPMEQMSCKRACLPHVSIGGDRGAPRGQGEHWAAAAAIRRGFGISVY